MPRNYSITVLAAAVLASICIIAFTYTMDPYRMYPEVPGLSPGTSVDLLLVMRLQAPYAVEHVRPDVLITGNSRSATFPPELLAQGNEASYNASLPGASLQEVRRMVEHAHAINPLKQLFLGLDPGIFLKSAEQNSTAEGESSKHKVDPGPQRLEKFFSANLVPDDPYRYRKFHPSLSERWRYTFSRFKDFGRSLFSLDAVEDSWNMLFGNGSTGSSYHDNGTWDLEGKSPSPPMARYLHLVRKKYVRSINEEASGINVDGLNALLDFTAEHQIPTTLFLLPMQGLVLNTIELAGTWEQHLQWQRDVVELVFAHDSDTTIFGVEDQARVVLDKVGTSQPLFVDGSHLTRKAGDEILSCLVAQPCQLGFQPTALTRHSIDAYLKQTEKLRKQYAKENPKHLARLREVLGLDKSS